MKRVFFISVMMLCFHVSMIAQFSVKGGANLAKQSIVVGKLAFSSNTKVGALVGINYNHDISKSFSLRPGIQYSSKGAQFDNFGTLTNVSTRFIEVPMDIVFTNNVFSIHTGFYLAYLMSATEDDRPSRKNFAPIDIGLNLGIIINFRNIGLGVNCGFGLSDANKNVVNGSSLRNEAIGLFLTYTQ